MSGHPLDRVIWTAFLVGACALLFHLSSTWNGR